MFHFHKWGPWSDPIQTYDGGHKQQWRCCSVCNKAGFRTLMWDKQSAIDLIIKALKQSRETK